eukprot:3184498-Pyramimonas_sp.AAC.1
MRHAHPQSRRPVDLADTPGVHTAAALRVDEATAAREVWAFPRGSAWPRVSQRGGVRGICCAEPPSTP